MECPNCSSKKLSSHYKYCPYCAFELTCNPHCEQCNSKLDSNSKYCHQCGAKAFKERKVSFSDSIPPVSYNGITIEFFHSKSASFPQVLSTALKLEMLEAYGAKSKSYYRVNLALNEIAKLVELVVDLKPIRKKSVYINGDKKKWDEVFYFVECFEEKKKSYRPKLYCFGYDSSTGEVSNPWGCRHSELWHQNSFYWGTWGKWVGDKVWQFDKERIKFELEKQLNKCKYCPAYNKSNLDKSLEALPDKVFPEVDENWTFNSSLVETENSIFEEMWIGNTLITKYLTGAHPYNNKATRDVIIAAFGDNFFDEQ